MSMEIFMGIGMKEFFCDGMDFFFFFFLGMGFFCWTWDFFVLACDFFLIDVWR